tara:strand:- start:1873 stop:2886 length:1014 start_codon:yes stop_codon:yes gene_type:complete
LNELVKGSGITLSKAIGRHHPVYNEYFQVLDFFHPTQCLATVRGVITMSTPSSSSVLYILSSLVLVSGLAWAGSQGGAAVGSVPLFALCLGFAILLQWVAFIPAYAARTERYFDLMGSLTYLSVIALGIGFKPEPDLRSILLAGLVTIWAARLGTFLFRRVRVEGKDGRFDAIKQSFGRFLFAWTLQGVWVCFTAGAALAVITSNRAVPMETMGWLGLLIWSFGFLIEVVADRQKSRFRQEPTNKKQFISSGLWAWSRHPNYFGEIVLWIGVALIAAPVLQGWQFITLLSPVFVTILLTMGSGIPMLEERADNTWGGQADYEEYKASTPILLPRAPR